MSLGYFRFTRPDWLGPGCIGRSVKSSRFWCCFGVTELTYHTDCSGARAFPVVIRVVVGLLAPPLSVVVVVQLGVHGGVTVPVVWHPKYKVIGECSVAPRFVLP